MDGIGDFQPTIIGVDYCYFTQLTNYLGVSKNRGYTKMDGENNGKPYFLMDDLGETPLFLETPTWNSDSKYVSKIFPTYPERNIPKRPSGPQEFMFGDS